MSHNFLFLSFAVFFSVNAFADPSCENFSGVYQYAPNPKELTLTVSETECSSITFSYFYPATNGQLAQSYQTDGVRRQTSEDPNQIVYETSVFVDATLVNTVEFFQKATQQTTTAVTTYQLDKDGNFSGVDNFYDANGKLYGTDTRAFLKSK